MKALIVSSLALIGVLGWTGVSVAGPAAGQAFGTRSRAALARNLDQQRPYQLTGTAANDTEWRLERRQPTSTRKRESAFVHVRGEDAS